jgi:diguanylate cyclase (GGDEF)-like protein
LLRPLPPRTAFITDLLIANGAILAAAAIVVTTLVRIAHGRFAADMHRVHEALRDVLAGRYRPSGQATAIREFDILLKDTEDLALKIQKQSEELRQQSLSDPLTGVFNRRYFDLMLNHLHGQSRRQPPAFLVILDLDGFKQVNDLLGHPAGDRVLRDCAGFLQNQVRASDIVTRIGGDEFALILNRMDPDSVSDWLTQLGSAFDRSYQPDGAPRCHLSIGATPVDSSLYDSPQAVFAAADSAMYRAKQGGFAGRSRHVLALAPSDLTAALGGH